MNLSEKEKIDFIKQLAEIDDVAAEAGGYVLPPSSVKHSKKFEEDFTTMRKYCVEHNKKITELTIEDYGIMGIRPF